MVWCRNFDGGRSFTSTLGHNWQFATEPWFRDMILNAIQWTSGQEYANCVTFNEVRDLLAEAADDGNVTAAGNTALQRRAGERRRGLPRGRRRRARRRTRRRSSRRPSAWPTRGADGGDALLELQSKGVELVNWMSGNESGAADPDAAVRARPGRRRRHRAGDARR